MKNFSKSQYLGDSQNWSVDADGSGYTYFANNKGLLEFDGISFRLYPSPNGNIIRCVMVDTQGRIFTSGYRELGFWKRAKDGSLRYTSLTSLASGYFSPNVEFWKITQEGDRIFFHSFMQLMVYEQDRISVINLPGFSNAMFNLHGTVIIDLANGLYKVKENGIVPYLTGDFFRGKEIRFLFQRENGELLIGTASEGIFLFRNGTYSPYLPEWTEYFVKNKINRATLAPDGSLIIGTILDGLVAFDPLGNNLFRFNTRNGLQNNTVLGVLLDSKLNLWLALDHGIDYLSFQKNPSVEMHPVKNIGAVYAAALYHDQFYLGTNQGLYVKPMDQSDDEFRLVPQTQGQVWSCMIFDNKLFVGHNNGTFLIDGKGIQKITSVAGAFAITKDSKRPDFLLQSTYSNLVSYKMTPGSVPVSVNVGNFNDLIQYVESDNDGFVWAGHMHRGIYRLRLDEGRNNVVESTYYGVQSPFRKDNGIHPFRIGERIVFATGDKLYTYDDLKDSIVDFQFLNKRLGSFARATRILPATNHRYWFIAAEAIGLFEISDDKVTLLKSFPIDLFAGQLIENFENICSLSDGEAILCMENGYAKLKINSGSGLSVISENRLSLRAIYASSTLGKSDTLSAGTDGFSIPYAKNNLQFHFSFPLLTTERVIFRAYLEGIDPDWRPAVTVPKFRFDRLPRGKYTLHTKAVDVWGAESPESIIHFEVLPPWYMTNWAVAFYVLLIVYALYLFRRAIVTQTRRKEKRHREEKERELIRLRNEKLQDEVSFKSQELANLTMSIIKKNEFLIELKKTLRQQKNQLDSRYPDKYYQQIVKKIDENIASHDDWKIFETNFERAHEEFVRRLKAGFPSLTPSDLRLCAYLRMNLTSKEMAPLLGISVRGIENHRYRLRKKMGLDINLNLNEFMMNL
ncbi:MAG: regulator [Marinilabiliales bacterium]|nr:regulator [Marinilabiliales bacterium]